MLVITLNQARFEQVCRELYNKIDVDKYDALVAIESGGGYVIDEIIKSDIGNTKVFNIKAQRESTKKKNYPFVAKLIRYLPRTLNDVLRVIEHKIREKRFGTKGAEERKVIDNMDFKNFLYKLPEKLLIIDDSIDTGTSMKAVSDYIALISPDTALEYACIVKTFKSPLVEPDISLTSDVLIRFPWSTDSR